MACRCTWTTTPHKTWGECIRSKNLKVGYCQSATGRDASRQKAWDRDLDAYAAARKEGIQPESTAKRHVDYAKTVSDREGVAFDAGRTG